MEHIDLQKIVQGIFYLIMISGVIFGVLKGKKFKIPPIEVKLTETPKVEFLQEDRERIDSIIQAMDGLSKSIREAPKNGTPLV